MAKKKNKKDKSQSASSDPVEAVRAAVERTFHATTDSASGTHKRTRQLVDEVSNAAARIRTTIEELRVLDEVKGLRNDIEALGRRVAALESDAAKPAARSTAASRSRSTRTTSRAKATGAKTTTAKTTTAAAKPSGTARAKPAAARKSRPSTTSRSRSRSPRAPSG